MSQTILLKEWEDYSELRTWIIWQDYLYYGLDSPEVSDRVYDTELKKLEKMEEKFSHFCTPDSPTQIPGHNRFKT